MDPMELEHVIGFAGDRGQVLCVHPTDHNVMVVGMGRNVVVQDLRDDHSQAFLQGHDESVSVIAVSKAGTFVASGQQGSTRTAVPEADVLVWDLAQKIDVYRLRGIRDCVTALAFSPDEMFLAGAGADGTILIWDMQTGEVVASVGSGAACKTLLWGPLEAGASARRPNYTLFGTVGHKVDSFVMSYSVANMHYQVSEVPFRLPAGMVRDYTGCCLSPCGTALLLCTSIGEINVFQLDSRVYRASFPVCSGGARHMCAAGPYVFVGGGDGSIKRLTGSGSNWRLDAEIAAGGPVSSISGWCDAQSGQLSLLAGTESGQITVLDGGRMQVQRVIVNETAPVVRVAFKSSCSVRFATLNSLGQVHVWDLSDYTVVAHGQGPRGDTGLSLTFDDHDEEAVAGYNSGAVRAFCAQRGPTAGTQTWEIAQAHRDGVSAICATQLYYATGGARGGVRLWSRTSRAQLFEFADHMGKPVTGLVPDVKLPHLLHSCGADRSVFSYDLKKERRVVHHQWNSHGTFTAMSQRLDSETELITAGTDGRLLTWDFDVAEPVSQVTASGHGQGVAFTCVQVSPTTGKYVAASSSDARVRVWDLTSGALVATSPFNGFADISSLAWSPDEKQLVSVGLDRCICVWNFYEDAVLEAEQGGHK
mmetsp:Transcript_1219/g.3538  ORF Transcript_1219/g.3538 Transcript_1219/m.3538 type:complete len:647 (-) Transcript_1219:66-2006(-)